MKTLKILITAILLLQGYLQASASKDTIPLLKVSIYKPKGLDRNTIISYSDSLKINFDGGFKGDTILIKSGTKSYNIKSLKSDPLFGYAESLRIPKLKGKQRLFIFINGQFAGSLKLRKKYSEVHVNYSRPHNELRWVYHVYRFVYL